MAVDAVWARQLQRPNFDATQRKLLRRTVASLLCSDLADSGCYGQIGRHVNEAACGSDAIARSISRTADVAHNTTEGADESQRTAHQLAQMTTDFQRLVERFKV
jgi:hypothetical protein